MTGDRRELRRQARAARRSLAAGPRLDATLAVAHHLIHSAPFRNASTVAAYVAADSELDPGPFVGAARALGRRILLPVLGGWRRGRLRFLRTDEGDALRPNRYRILEPVRGQETAPAFLDLVLVPLVAFDDAGNRLGMGAGHYDRTFAYRRHRTIWRRPWLVGVAFDCQRSAGIAPQPWDVRLDAVVTETGVDYFE